MNNILLILLALIIVLATSCGGVQKTDVKCIGTYANNSLHGDSCKSLGSQYFCSTGIYPGDARIQETEEFGKEGVCVKQSRGPGSIGP